MDTSLRGDTREVQGTNESNTPFTTSVEESGEFDPQSSKFRYKDWLYHMFGDNEKCRMNAMGVAYRNLDVCGFGTSTDYQKTFANYPLAYLSKISTVFAWRQESKIDILQGFEGLVDNGEMLLVLGRPGSGCSTLLKVLSGQTHGLCVGAKSMINYQGNSYMVSIRTYSEY